MQIAWRAPFTNAEIHELHSSAFDTRLFTEQEWDWVSQTTDHSLGWVSARDDGHLVGFCNVITDGFVHAWIQDVMVLPRLQRNGLGVRLVHAARDEAQAAGCEWLHVDFDAELSEFYFTACGFQSTTAGLIDLT